MAGVEVAAGVEGRFESLNEFVPAGLAAGAKRYILE